MENEILCPRYRKLLTDKYKEEGALNLILVLKRSISVRIRGEIFRRFYGFGQKLTIGKFPRFKGLRGISIADNVNFGFASRVENWSHNKCKIIYIGKNTSFGDYLHIGGINFIKIGENNLFGSNILIIDHNHGSTRNLKENVIVPVKRELISNGPIIIGNNNWIADNVVIIAPCKIGDNNIISAGSVIKGDYGSNEVIRG